MIDEKEIIRVLETFEAFMRKPNRTVRCPLCLSPYRLLYNRALLDHSRTDKSIANDMNCDIGTVRHHRVDCLVTRGGANPKDVESPTMQARKRFPLMAKAVTQKKWYVDELIHLLDEAQKKNPPDRRELFKLAKEIDKAAEEYRKAKAEAKLAKQEKGEPAEIKDEDLELSEAQEREMGLVKPKQEVNGADHAKPA